jgi:hypothetical protein
MRQCCHHNVGQIGDRAPGATLKDYLPGIDKRARKTKDLHEMDSRWWTGRGRRLDAWVVRVRAGTKFLDVGSGTGSKTEVERLARGVIG